MLFHFSDEDDEEPVYIDDDEYYEGEPEYISSEGEEEWKDYRRQPALGKLWLFEKKQLLRSLELAVGKLAINGDFQAILD